MFEMIRLDVVDPPVLPDTGLPLVFGLIPLVFSLVLFGLPLLRQWRSSSKQAEAAHENAERAVLKTVFDKMQEAARSGTDASVSEASLQKAWQKATGKAAGEKELLRAIVALGGDVDVDALAAGRGLYRFRDLEAEVEELKKQREQASDEEKAVGAVVFVS